MIHPKQRRSKIDRVANKSTEDRRRAGQGNWRQRFFKESNLPQGSKNDLEKFIPEYYNYAWGYF